MNDREAKDNMIYEEILRDMGEGVVILELDGRVRYMNKAASDILGMDIEEVLGSSLAPLLFMYEENDRFSQTIVNAVINPEQKNYDLVPYYTGTEYRQLNVMTSFLWEDGAKRGIIMMISDITELSSLKIRYTEQITELLNSLVKALSAAIDERSRYTSNHTQNMVKMGRRSWTGWTIPALRCASTRKESEPS
jgi:PAS domain S-box-containing protein